MRKICQSLVDNKMTPSKCFGVIADIQYADHDDATDFSGNQNRYYRNSLEIVKRAATEWRDMYKVEFIAQLGDIIDSKAKKNKGSDIELSKVLGELMKSNCQYMVNIIGNHELYNFKREQLESKLKVTKDGSTWYSFKPWNDVSLRLVALDGYDISTIEGLDSGKTAKASEFIKQYNPNDIHTFGVCWSEGLEGTDKRFMPYNGMLGTQQMEWLQETLKAGKENQEKVMVLTHIPIHPNAADNLCLLWNYKEVLELLEGSGCVVAVLAGHDHDGGYTYSHGIHHYTLSSPLLCGPQQNAFMTVQIQDNNMVLAWDGHDGIPSKVTIEI